MDMKAIFEEIKKDRFDTKFETFLMLPSIKAVDGWLYSIPSINAESRFRLREIWRAMHAATASSGRRCMIQ
jgi:hypothetical protein